MAFSEKQSSTEDGYSKPLWRKMADLGWMGVLFPEKYGGMDGNFQELIYLLEEMGRVLVPGPFISYNGCRLLPAPVWIRKAKNRYSAETDPRRPYYYSMPYRARCRRGVIETSDSVFAEGRFLSVERDPVICPFARSADYFLVDSNTPEGQGLFLVDSKNPGIAFNPIDTLVSDKQCELVLDRVGCRR